MRYIPMAMAKPGMCLAFDVYDSYNRTLISSQSVLTNSYIQKLNSLGIDGVYINDAFSEGIEIEQVITPQLRSEGLSSVRERDVDKCQDVAKRIVEQMLSKDSCSLDIADLRTFDDYTYAHSVNVATVSCAIGLGLQLSEAELINIVLAGLLHDIGKLDIAPEVINKPSRLTQEEYMLMKTHVQLSYEYIRERIDISAQVKQAVLYHHENMDGTGYPSGAMGNGLSLITRIIHVADVYDALISKRPYKEPYSKWEAIEFMKGARGTLFDEDAVNALISFVPFYPKGTMVMLADGREGIVVDNTGERNLFPLIRFEDMTELDLLAEENKTLKITVPSDEYSISMEESERQRAQMVKELKRCVIYLVDGAKTTYHTIADKLEYLYDIQCYHSANMAIGITKKNGTPDLYMIDADSTEEDGYEEIKKIVEFTNNAIPVVVLSSARDVRTVMKYRNLRIMRYILKPFTMVYIRSELRNILHNFGNIPI